MTYNFDEPVDRQDTSSVKYDFRKEVFGTEDVIPMWVADMDFKVPPFIIKALKDRLNHEIFGYTIRRKEYFSSIRNWLSRRYSWDVAEETIVFSPGIVPALNLCTLAYTSPGDKIIIQPPVYFPFFNAVTDHGRQILYNQLIEKDGRWSIDFEDLAEKAKDGAKMLILCNPHNPVGRAWNKEELERLSEICIQNNILIISDEIHSDLVLPDYKHIPVASLSDKTANTTITCIAPSKTFNLAGLSTSSLIISNKELREKFEESINSFHITQGNIFGTEASIAAYENGDEWLNELLIFIRNNINYLQNRLKGQNYIKPVIPEATYMIWLDCRAMEMKPEELNNFFIKEAGVGMIEGSVFGPGGEGFMRMNLACPISTLEKALDNIIKALKKTGD